MASPLDRVLGGSPVSVLMRLVLVSLLVGAFMAWLGVDPLDLLAAAERFASHLYADGFDALRRFGRFIAAGATIVVPVWLVLRVVDIGSRPSRAGSARDPLQGGPPADGLRTETPGWRHRNDPSASAS